MRSSVSAEPCLLRRIEEQRGSSLNGLLDQVELSPGGAADLRGQWEQPTEILPAHTDLGFSQSLMGAASKSGSFSSQGGQLFFPIISLSYMLIEMKIVLGEEDIGRFPLSYLLY